VVKRSGRIWWLVHQWTGLKLTLLMSFVLLTGTLAVFSNEIDWMLRPALRVDSATVTTSVNWAAIASNIAKVEPNARVQSLNAPVDKWFAASATVSRINEAGEHELGFIYAHPTTGEIQGAGHWVGAQRILRNLHRHLNLPLSVGVPIVSSLALLLLVTFVTSFVVYKKWWRGFFRPIRVGRARMTWGDVHRLAGVWTLWFVLLMALTGLWYLVESTFGRSPPLPEVRIAPTEMDNADVARALAVSLAAAQRAFPELRIERIVFPTESSGAFRFEGQHRAVLVRERANAVWTDATHGDVKLVSDGRDLNVHQRISEMADPLHFGYFGGLFTKSIWFLFGALLTSLSISGAAIYTLRLASKTVQSSAIATVWQGMGRLRWVAAALVMVGLALVPTLWS
jgi:uncharacterized iron-regulated membrane protein